MGSANWPGAGGSGASLAPWFSNVAAFIQGLQPTLLAPTLVDECASLAVQLEVSGATGTGTCTVLTTATGGVIRTATGATIGSFRFAKNRGGVAAPVVSNTRTDKWAVATRCKIVATQANFAIDLCGFTDEATFGTSIAAISSVSAVNYILKVGSHAGQNTGVAFAVGTWVTLAMIADGTSVRAYAGAASGSSLAIIGVAQAQVTAPTAPGAWLFNAQNLASAANVSADCDSVIVLTERAS
jgi:hypothetical protein